MTKRKKEHLVYFMLSSKMNAFKLLLVVVIVVPVVDELVGTLLVTGIIR